MTIIFWILLTFLTVFSYGFVDINLHLSANRLFLSVQQPLSHLVIFQRSMAAGIFAVLLAGLFICFLRFLNKTELYFVSWQKLVRLLTIAAVILVLSFPALTYDLFNYIATAKVAYTYHENPYIVMPIEIPNEPNLTFTRAANKVALYGPVWLIITAIPHYLGGGDVWRTILAFKTVNALVYLAFAYLIYRVTKNLRNVVFFALNPLVLIEVLMNGHNDLYMMFLALGSIVLWQRKTLKDRIWAVVLFVASLFIKGATLALTPLYVLRNITIERILTYAYIFMAAVFFIVAPIREELYPWYAVWLVTVASLLPFKSHRFIYGFTIVLSFALELRALPYIWMGYYGGPGPLLRQLLTAVPVVCYFIYFAYRRLQGKSV